MLFNTAFAQKKYAIVLCQKKDDRFKQEASFTKAVLKEANYKILKINNFQDFMKKTLAIKPKDSVILIYTGHGKENPISSMPDIHISKDTINSFVFVDLLETKTNNVKFFIHSCNKINNRTRQYSGICAKKKTEIDINDRTLFNFLFNLETNPLIKHSFFNYFN